jgi:hypothetical protein
LRFEVPAEEKTGILKVCLKRAHLTFLSIDVQGSDWVDPDDPNVIAENELLGAALSIDKAAKKLAALRPRRGPKASTSVPFSLFVSVSPPWFLFSPLGSIIFAF